MVTKVLKSLFFTIIAFCYTSANAYDFVNDGVYYKILSVEEATCEVASAFDDEYAESTYSGYVNIPETVFDNFSNTDYTVVGVGKWAFYSSQLEGISLPSTIIKIEESAFNSCKGIASFVIPEKVEFIGDNAFSDSDLAVSLFIPNCCKYIGKSAFAYTNITELTIEPEYLSPSIKRVIEGGAFSYCKYLSYVNLNQLHDDFVGNPFIGCSNLNSIEGYGQYTDYSNKGNLMIDGCLYKFEEYDNIRYLELICCPGGMNGYTSPNSYTGIENKIHILTTLGSGAFGGCTRITFLDIPNTVKTIKEYALFMPLGETSPDHDYIYRKVIIPKSVETIGSDVFGWWGKNWDIFLHSTHITDIYSSSAPGDGSKFGTIHIPYGTLSSFGTEWTRKAFNVVDDIIDIVDLTANQGDTGEYWATFYSDITHYKVSSGTKVFKVNLTGTTLTMSEITDGIVTKEQGVVLKSSSANISMTPNALASADDYSGNSLVGTTTSITNPGNAYVLNYKAGIGAGFYKLKDNGTIGANQAYLVYDSPAIAREYFGFNETTCIEMPVVEGNDDTDAVVHDLQGRRVQNPAKGLYIVNGKKVFINK